MCIAKVICVDISLYEIETYFQAEVNTKYWTAASYILLSNYRSRNAHAVERLGGFFSERNLPIGRRLSIRSASI